VKTSKQIRQQRLLYNDREMGGYIRPDAGQRLGKHVPAATVTHGTGETGCCLRGPRRGDIKEKIGATSSVDNWQSVLYWSLEGRT
jgi:hypothetical protein